VRLNPFVYSRPLAACDVVDREQETKRLLALAAGGHYARLYAPRRYGKTSLLLKALAEGERREQFVPVLVDLYGVLSLADVTVRIERAYAAQLKGRLRELADRFLAATGLGLSLGAYGISVKLQLERRADPLPALHALLDLPLRLSAGGGRRALIAFDEFQDVTNVEGLEALLRSHIQFQGEVACYLFAGSEPALMRQLFETRAKPLYGQAEPVRLGRLDPGPLSDHIAARFAATDRNIGEVLTPMLDTARGHPQRAMLLANRLWLHLPAGTTANAEHWAAALAQTMAEAAPECEALWRSLSLVEQKTLRAMVETGGSLYRPRVLQRLGLAKPSAQSAVRNLIGKAHVERQDGRFEIVDPLFARWLGGLGRER
jgi:hypothetical protein